jgi:hypothetical protein
MMSIHHLGNGIGNAVGYHLSDRLAPVRLKRKKSTKNSRAIKKDAQT